MAATSAAANPPASTSTSTSAYLDLTPYLPNPSKPTSSTNTSTTTNPPPFSPTARASTLLHATLPTAAQDTPPLPLSPALTRLLFDAQELDTRIDNLTTASATPLLTHTDELVSASGAVLEEIEKNVEVLVRRYERLEREVGERWRGAREKLVVAERVAGVLGLVRRVGRGVGLGRRLVGEVDGGVLGKGTGKEKKDQEVDYRAMVRAAEIVVGLRRVYGGGGSAIGSGSGSGSGSGNDGGVDGLERVDVMVVLREKVVVPRERRITALAQQIIREFAMSSLVTAGAGAGAGATNSASVSNSTRTDQAQAVAGAGAGGSGIGSGSGSNATLNMEKTNYAKVEETKSKMMSALSTLYLLSPLHTDASTTAANTSSGSSRSTTADFKPTLLLTALQAYLQTALTSSLASLTRSLVTLQTLERTLLEISARCQNIVALERLLKSTRPPPHPLLQASASARQRHGSSASSSSDDSLSLSLSDNDKDSNGNVNDDKSGSNNSSTSSSGANSIDVDTSSFLTPLLAHLDTSSLPSFFWRSLAGSLSSRVREILGKGGVAARNLRSNKERVRDAIRRCVHQGSRLPAGSQWIEIDNSTYASTAGMTPDQKKRSKQGEAEAVENWEREAAVMVGAVTGPLGR